MILMRAYSRDLRERIVAALVAHEESHAEIAERFVVSLSFVDKLWRRWRRTGSCAAQPHGGGRRRSLREAEGLIRAALARQPDMTLAALCERVAQAGHPQVTIKTMCLELQRLQLRLKKSHFRLVSATLHG
jgi:transposase